MKKYPVTILQIKIILLLLEPLVLYIVYEKREATFLESMVELGASKRLQKKREA
jgi:hypothetical protein